MFMGNVDGSFYEQKTEALPVDNEYMVGVQSEQFFILKEFPKVTVK